MAARKMQEAHSRELPGINAEAARLRGYALHHARDVAERRIEVHDDLLEVLLHPQRNPGAEKRAEMLRGLLRQELSYMREVINDSQRAE